jgi:metal-sulfur cluster biosynthetic enzyme
MSEHENKPTRAVWQSETDYPQLCDTLRTGLREVVDPEIGLSVIDLGLIRDVTITDDNVMVKMILTTPFCPYASVLIENVRVKAEEVLKRPASIDLALDPWDFSMLEEGVDLGWGM